MRFPNIQLLRLAAAVGVALFHLGAYANTVLGVDVPWLHAPILAGFPVPLFFAVSGFVLAHAVRSAPPGRFLLARALRLYPGYWLALVLTLAAIKLGLFTDAQRTAVGFLNAHTVTLWPAGPGRVIYYLGVEWSLVYEVFLSAAIALLSLAGPRRGVPALAAVWLALILVTSAAWPGYASTPIPHWSRIAMSAYNVPFLLGVMTYWAKDRGRRWRWAVLALVVGLLANATRFADSPEAMWCAWGVAAAAAVWLAVQFRQVNDPHPLARLGDYTYGLFLLHVPLMSVVLYAAARAGWAGRTEVLVLAGAAAVGGGLLFGRLECAIHARLRPLSKLDSRARVTWLRTWGARRMSHG